MAKFNNSVKTSNHWVLTCCNILLLHRLKRKMRQTIIKTSYLILYNED